MASPLNDLGYLAAENFKLLPSLPQLQTEPAVRATRLLTMVRALAVLHWQHIDPSVKVISVVL